MEPKAALINLETARQVRKLKQGMARLEEVTSVSHEQASAAMADLVAQIKNVKLKPGPAGKNATAKQVANAVHAYLEPRLKELAGQDGKTPTKAEIRRIIESVIDSDPQRFRGKDGRSIKSMRLRQDDMVEVVYSDGAKDELGPVVREIEKPQPAEPKRIAIIGGSGGISEARAIQLIEEYSMATDPDAEYEPIPFSTNATARTLIHAPPAGQAIRLRSISALNDPDNLNSADIRIYLGGKEIHRGYAIAKRQTFTGPVDGLLEIELSNIASVSGTAYIEEITP